MLLLSKLFPKLRGRGKGGDKVTKGVTSQADVLCLGEKPHQEYNCKVILLDDSELPLNVKPTAKGQAVLDKVNSHLNLVEKDYFGLRFVDNVNQTHWLDAGKNVGSQLKSLPPHTLYYGVKFYAADPCKLHEEVTRYQFFLQIKQDILQGRLPLAFDLAAELCAYAVQSELGDYDPKRHSPGYVSEFRFTPNQTEELEVRISQLHRVLNGQVPAAAEYRFLDKVKWLEMYGVDLHPVQGEGNIEYNLGLTPTGIVVFKNKSKVGNYFWPRLSKITFKGRYFMVRVRDKNNDENTYAFECSSKAACKHLWKCCVELHAFFRLTSVKESFRSTGRLFNLGSSKYRYSGRTEKQVQADNASRPPPKVERRPSKRYQRRAASETRLDAAYNEPSTVDTENIMAASVVMTPSNKFSAYQRAEGYQSAPESPRSTRSAPWISHKGGLYTSGRESPLSVRSEKMMFPKRVQSGSESESAAPRRNRHHGRIDSDVESEYMAQNRRRSRVPAESESESEAHFRQRRHRKSTESLPHNDHWKNVEQRVRDGNIGSVTSMASDPTGGARRRRKRSRSPGNRRPPEELAQHFKYIDPEEAGISQDQLREIGYEKVVVAGVPAMNVKTAARSRHKSPRHRSCGELNEPCGATAAATGTGAPDLVIPDGEAPPPYIENQKRRQQQKQHSQPNLHYPEPANNRVPPLNRDYYYQTDFVPQPHPERHNDQRPSTSLVKTKPSTYSYHPTNNITDLAPSPSSLPHQSSPRTPGAAQEDPNGSLKHTRDDSGLGPEQDNGSLNSSSRMISPTGSNTSQSLNHNQMNGHQPLDPMASHMNGNMNTYYHPTTSKSVYSSHASSEPYQRQNHRRTSRQPAPSSSLNYHYNSSGTSSYHHGNQAYRKTTAPSTSRYSGYNGTVQSHSEKMTEL